MINIKRNPVILIGLLLLLATALESHPQNAHKAELFRHPGVQWLSWSADERENFVYGYIQGYGHGMNEACSAADELFEKDKPHIIGHDNVPSTFPSARCRQSVRQYSNASVSLSTGPGFSPYTMVITDFYMKYPEYRDTPFTQLMEFLTGTKALTAQDLYSKLTGKSAAPPR